MNKQHLIEVLKVATEIVFIKTNGDTRKMHCVVNPDQPANYGASDAVGVIETVTGAYKAIKAGSVLSVNGVMI